MNIDIQTSSRRELVNITDKVRGAVKETRVENGICVVYTRHTTTSIIINENEHGLKKDILEILRKIVPEGAGYAHDTIDNNAHAHLQAILLGASAMIPIENSGLTLGAWQSIFLVELDGPRRRTVQVRIISA